jgi:ribose transport system substrate-binding protein
MKPVISGRRLRKTWALCALMLTTAAPTTAPADAADRTVGLSMHFMRDDYAVRLSETVTQQLGAHPGSRVIVTDANADPSKQLTDMENLIVQGVDAIIVVPIDEKAILPAIRKASGSGIPVVAITHIPGADVLSTIGANGDYANGRASGELLVRATGGSGRIAVVGIPYSLWRIDERERGFRDAIAGTGLEIAVRQDALDQARVQDIVSGMLVAHPDLVGIWCTFSNQVVGAADALRMARRRDVALTGIDADKAIIQRIRSGWVTGTAAQFPAVQGRLAAEALIAHFEGRPVAATYDVPVELVTVENAAEMSRKIWGD